MCVQNKNSDISGFRKCTSHTPIILKKSTKDVPWENKRFNPKEKNVKSMKRWTQQNSQVPRQELCCRLCAGMQWQICQNTSKGWLNTVETPSPEGGSLHRGAFKKSGDWLCSSMSGYLEKLKGPCHMPNLSPQAATSGFSIQSPAFRIVYVRSEHHYPHSHTL